MSLFFFFSSRRRHTRWPRDWSSDVCSSDLPEGYEYSPWGTYHRADHLAIGVDRSDTGTGYSEQYFEKNACVYRNKETRSEERRVGKEGRYPWEAEEIEGNVTEDKDGRLRDG